MYASFGAEVKQGCIFFKYSPKQFFLNRDFFQDKQGLFQIKCKIGISTCKTETLTCKTGSFFSRETGIGKGQGGK